MIKLKAYGTCPKCLKNQCINPRWSSSTNGAGRQEIVLKTYCPQCKIHLQQHLFIDTTETVTWDEPDNLKSAPGQTIIRRRRKRNMV